MSEAYTNALRLFERVARRDALEADEPCRSFLFDHGRRTKRATIFFHGITASPRQFLDLAQRAYAAGDNVLVPRLPRHGHPDRLGDALRHLRTSDLLDVIDESLRIARGLGVTVRVVGFSLGGLLCAWIAQHHVVDEAIAISPFVGVAGIPAAFTKALATSLRRSPNVFLWWNPIRRDALLPRHGYPRFATRAIGESLAMASDLLLAARGDAPRSAVTLVVNRGELGVNNSAVVRLAKAWRARGARVEVRRLTGLGLSHDIIEPLRVDSKVDRSYPQLLPILGIGKAKGKPLKLP